MRRTRIRSPFVRHTFLTYQTRNFPPPAPLPENAKHRGYFPGCYPPSPVSPNTVLGHPSRRYLSCHASLHTCLLKYLLFLPPLLSLDTETDAAAAPFDYGVDDPSLSEQP